MALINISNVKRRALDYSHRMRAGKFTRVSKDFLEEIDRLVDRTIQTKVHSHPSKGKTLMGGQ